jgi:serine/threonine-protein kinase RsbT
MKDGFSTGKSLGVGLPGAKRLVNEFSIKSNVGKGTSVSILKWKNG